MLLPVGPALAGNNMNKTVVVSTSAPTRLMCRAPEANVRMFWRLGNNDITANSTQVDVKVNNTGPVFEEGWDRDPYLRDSCEFSKICYNQTKLHFLEFFLRTSTRYLRTIA